jgi:hypothetical protein
MREAIKDIDRLRHIEECIEHINDYLNGKSFDLPLLREQIIQYIDELNNC